jgi:hypothetical protein
MPTATYRGRRFLRRDSAVAEHRTEEITRARPGGDGRPVRHIAAVPPPVDLQPHRPPHGRRPAAGRLPLFVLRLIGAGGWGLALAGSTVFLTGDDIAERVRIIGAIGIIFAGFFGALACVTLLAIYVIRPEDARAQAEESMAVQRRLLVRCEDLLVRFDAADDEMTRLGVRVDEMEALVRGATEAEQIIARGTGSPVRMLRPAASDTTPGPRRR